MNILNVAEMRFGVPQRECPPHGESVSATTADVWQTLGAGHWLLVERFEHDGKRYALMVEAPHAPSLLQLLSSRERQVVRRAHAGAHNKLIAYELGISHSTVRVLVARAAWKLGARSRAELLRRLGPALKEAPDSSSRLCAAPSVAK
ncbi:MAG: helix-turn-helix transcriptional regulator [Polyangiaceae bacterium]